MKEGKRMNKKYYYFLCSLCISIVILVSGCSLYETRSNTSNINNSSQSSSESLEVTNDGNFSYGDEHTFYKNDEKSNIYPTPISVVTKYLEATKTNDYDAWLSTITPERKKAFAREANGEFGVISLDILAIYYEKDTQYKHNILKSERAIEKGLTADNIAVVDALYQAEYDGTKVPSNSGKIDWLFFLIREDKNSPWYIQEWGYGYGGI